MHNNVALTLKYYLKVIDQEGLAREDLSRRLAAVLSKTRFVLRINIEMALRIASPLIRILLTLQFKLKNIRETEFTLPLD